MSVSNEKMSTLEYRILIKFLFKEGIGPIKYIKSLMGNDSRIVLLEKKILWEISLKTFLKRQLHKIVIISICLK